MAQKVDMIMATQVGIDVGPATRSLRDLKTNINIIARSAKEEARAIKESSDSVNTAKSSYDQYSTAVSRSRELVDQLTKRQSDLIGMQGRQQEVVSELTKKINELKDARSKENQKTDESRQKYQELSEQITMLQRKRTDANHLDTSLNSVNRQLITAKDHLNRYVQEQQKAKQAYDNEASGLNKLKQAYQEATNSSRTYAQSLDARGNHYAAQREQLRGMKEARQNLNQQLRLEKQRLYEASRSESTDASTQRRLRDQVNETKGKIGELSRSIDKLKTGQAGAFGKFNVFAQFRQGFRSVNSEAQNTEAQLHHTHGVFLGTFAGNLVSSAFTASVSALKMGIGSVIGAGVKFDQETQVMKASWETLTGSAGSANKMVSSIQNLSNKLGQPVELTDELAQQFYHVFDNQPKAMQLTQSFETMGDAIGLSSDRLKQVGMDFTHMMSSSTLQLGDLNQITDAFPMFGQSLLKYEQRVQKNAKLDMTTLRKQISAGKISSQDAITVMNQLGQRYKKASDNLMGTIPGMARQIRSKFSQLAGEVTQPLMTAQSPVFKAVSKWVADPKTDREFQLLGKKVSKAMQDVMSAIGGKNASSQVPQILNNIVNGVGNAISRAGSFIKKNGTSIRASIQIVTSTLSILRQVAGQVIGVMAKVLAIIFKGHSSSSTAKNLQSVAKGLNAISKNKLAIKVISGAVIALGGIIGVGKAGRTLGNLAVGFKNIGKYAGKAWEWTQKIGNVFSGLYKFGGKAVGVLKKIPGVFQLMARGASFAFNGIRSVVSVLATNPYVAAITAIVAIGTALFELYKHNTRFRNFVNGLFKDAKNAMQNIWNGVKAFGRNIGNFFTKTIPNTIRSAVKGVKDAGVALIRALEAPINAFLKGYRTVYNAIAGKVHLPSMPNIQIPVPGYASGGGIGRDQLAMVNDGGGSYYREMLEYQGRLYSFPARRNLLAYLPSGSNVINGRDSHLVAQLKGLPHYANGTISLANLSRMSSQMSSVASRFTTSMSRIASMSQRLNRSITRLPKSLTQISGMIKQMQQSFRALSRSIRQLVTTVQTSARSMNSSKSTKHYAEGTGTDQDQLAIVNDATGQDYQEAMVYNNQISLFPQERNLLQFIPRGAQILNAENTKELLSRIPHFAGGVGQLNSLVSGLRQNGINVHNAERAQFIKKVQQQLRKLIRQFKKEIKKAIDAYWKAAEQAKKAYAKTMYKQPSGVVPAYHKAELKAESDYDKTIGKARTSLTSAVSKAKSQDEVQSAYDEYNQAVADATKERHNSFAEAYKEYKQSKDEADQTQDKAFSEANFTKVRTVNLAKHNIAKAQAWARDNIKQFDAGLNKFARGGISSVPAIFGEAGPEAAIPLRGDAGTALNLMAQVADAYRTGDSVNVGSSNGQDMEKQVEALTQYVANGVKLLGQLLEGQGAQTGVISKKQDYNSNQAYQDFRSNLQNELYGRLS